MLEDSRAESFASKVSPVGHDRVHHVIQLACEAILVIARASPLASCPAVRRAYAGRSMCCHAPRGNAVLTRADGVPGREPQALFVPGRVLGAFGRTVRERCRSPGNTPRDSGPVRRARGRFSLSAIQFPPKRTRMRLAQPFRVIRVAWAVVRAGGTGRWLPMREDLVAKTVPLLFPRQGLTSRSRKYELTGASADRQTDPANRNYKRPFLSRGRVLLGS